MTVDFYKGQKFAFPSMVAFQKLMRYVFNNQRLASLKGYQARRDVAKNFTWSKAVDKIQERIKQIEKDRF